MGAPLSNAPGRAEALDDPRRQPPGLLRQIWIVTRKDLMIERRTGEIIVTGGFFGALLAVLASVAFYAGEASARYLAPGAIWIATAFAAVLAIGRTWHREREEGAIESLLSAVTIKSAIFFGKGIGVGLFLIAIEAVVVPIVSLLLHLDLPAVGLPLLLLLLLATIGLAASGTLFGAMTVRTRARELILAAVLFPLLTPTLVVGVAATRELVDGATLVDLLDYLKLLALFDAIFVIGGAAIFGTVME